MKIPELTVIIPAYNAESCIGECLKSLFEQTHSAAEIFVINDGSTDDTAAVVHRFSDRIRYYEQDNAGQGAARNVGLKNANGEFIAFLDADDYWKPDFLKRCSEFLRANPDVVAVNTGLITRMHDRTEIIHPAMLNGPDAPTQPFVIDDFYAFWAKHDHVRTGSAVIRRSVIDRAGGQRADLRVSQDLEYWGHIATFGKWGYIPEPLWVGNSRAAAAAPGWLRRYRKRRKLCSTVESWQKRIVPRLGPAQFSHFKVVRGRVAAGYAHNHILAGNPHQAREIVQTYGEELPRNRLTRLLIAGNRMGSTGWWLVCQTVLAHEYAKAMAIQLGNRRADSR